MRRHEQVLHQEFLYSDTIHFIDITSLKAGAKARFGDSGLGLGLHIFGDVNGQDTHLK
jgi:hypothetical protein